jgi:hypothetical protein
MNEETEIESTVSYLRNKSDILITEKTESIIKYQRELIELSLSRF